MKKRTIKWTDKEWGDIKKQAHMVAFIGVAGEDIKCGDRLNMYCDGHRTLIFRKCD